MDNPEDLIVVTPRGSIRAFKSSDPLYPGIWIEINGKNAVLAEFYTEEGYHKIHTWREIDDQQDVFIDTIWDELPTLVNRNDVQYLSLRAELLRERARTIESEILAMIK